MPKVNIQKFFELKKIKEPPNSRGFFKNNNNNELLLPYRKSGETFPKK
jgi:hypothetical protein